MKSRTVKVDITYTYEIEYESEEHLKDICKELKEAPCNTISGAGIVKDGSICSYSCRRVGDGIASKIKYSV